MSKRFPTRYFLAQDEDCHWYFVDADWRFEWEKWCAGRSSKAPAFAKRLKSDAPERVTFTNPVEE